VEGFCDESLFLITRRLESLAHADLDERMSHFRACTHW
jgi:hypothetical protein